MNNELKYKEEEIKYLQDKYGISTDFMLTDQYLSCKRDIFLQGQQQYKKYITNRNYKTSDKLFNNNKIHYKYTYSRFDSLISYDSFIEEFYNISNKKYKKSVFFTNSGMSAISSLLLSIKNCVHNINYIFPYKDIYFETFDFYNKFILENKKKTSNVKKNIVYIDSISRKFKQQDIIEFIKGIDNIYATIIDTTCFRGEELNKLISEVLKLDRLCILVRSHTKLDMMGAEISGLGSVAFLIPFKVGDANFDEVKDIIATTYYFLGKFGSLSIPENFPEIIFEKKFKRINSDRIERIEKNNEKLSFVLGKDLNNGKVILPTHKKFVLFVLNNSNALEVQKSFIKDKINMFVENNKNNIYHAGSFGFDYVAIDSYYDINEENFVIRISMNDDINNDESINDIKEFIKSNF